MLAAIASEPPARRTHRTGRTQRTRRTPWTQWSRRRLIAASVAVAAVAAAAGVAAHVNGDHFRYEGPQVLAWTGRPAAPLPPLGLPSVGRARTGAQLVEFAGRAAALASARAPGRRDWVYMKIEFADSTKGSGGFLFGAPNERAFSLNWVRVDWREYAGTQSFPVSLPPQTVVHTHISISRGGSGSLGGWKSVRYAYLNSLPTDPARLRAVILSQNNPRMPWYEPNPDVAVFSAIATLLVGQTEGVWLLPRLAVTLYRLLQQTPGVHFETAADLAGRTGLGFYMVTAELGEATSWWSTRSRTPTWATSGSPCGPTRPWPRTAPVTSRKVRCSAGRHCSPRRSCSMRGRSRSQTRLERGDTRE